MPKLIEFEGQTHEFPDDFTDADIARALSSAPAPASVPLPAQPSPPAVDPDRTARSQEEPTVAERVGRQLMLGTQAVGRGVANAAGFLPDIAALGLNFGLAGADTVAEQFGGNVDFRFKMPSQNIKDTATAAAKAVGVPLQTPETFAEKAIGNTIEFGTEALTGGAGLARAAEKRAASMILPDAVPQLTDPLLRPYLTSPAKAVAGDVVAGGAAGGALTASQELLPESVRKSGGGTVGALSDLFAMLVGGVGGGTATEIATGTPQTVADALRAARPAKNVTLDPETRLPVSNRVADKAAEFVQGQAIDPKRAAETITQEADAFRAAGLPVPTTGLISGDTGLEMLERGQRVKNSTGTILTSPDTDPGTKARFSFGERDTQLRDAARDQVNGLRPDGADPAAFPKRAEEIAAARTEAAQRQVDQAQGQTRGIDMARSGPANDLNANIGRGDAASRNIDETVRRTRDTELRQSRELFSDPTLTNAQVPDDPLRQTADGLAALDTQRAPLDPTVRKYVDRFGTRLDEEGNPVPPEAPLTMREVNANIAEVEADIQNNLANGAIVSQLRQVKDTLQGYAERLAAQGGPEGDAATRAIDNYRERVAPNFRQGAGGQFDLDLKRDKTGTNTRPTDTADRFLTRPEDAQDLMRIATLGGNEAQVAANARTWLFDKLAQTGVARDGAVDPEKLVRWRNVNNELLGQIPGLRDEVDGMVRAARRGEVLSTQAQTALRQAQDNLKSTEKAIGQSAIGAVAGKSPEKAVQAVFASGNPEAAMDELARTVGRNPQARDGLKAAVADHFAERVSGVNPANVSEGTQSINFAGLVKEFNRHERALAKVFGPDEMNALRRAHKILEPLAKSRGQATTGSITAENHEVTWRALEAGLKLYYGALKGGGILRSAKLATSSVWNGATEREAQRLVARMMFDPNLAMHLLTRDVAKVDSPAWNAKLQKLLRRVEAGRELLGQEED